MPFGPYRCPCCSQPAASGWRLLGPMHRLHCRRCGARLRLQRWLSLATHAAIAVLVPLGCVVGAVASGASGLALGLAAMGGGALAALPAVLLMLWRARLLPA
jgi:hypothetical protein